MRILVIDDDSLFAQTVVDALCNAGYDAERAGNGHAGLMHVMRDRPDLLLLDLGLPDVQGRDLCEMLRQHAINVPVIFLTGRRSKREIIAGLDAGADDYITKPCDLDELLARVRTVLRRAGRVAASEPDVLTINGVTVDSDRHVVSVRGTEVPVSPKEFNLLRLLMAHAGHVLPRDRILDTVWGADFYGDVKALDVYIRSLRRKVEVDADRPELIRTVRGVGYMFAPPETDLLPTSRSAGLMDHIAHF
jgi:two-component system, OmpR family, response regulator RegX3